MASVGSMASMGSAGSAGSTGSAGSAASFISAASLGSTGSASASSVFSFSMPFLSSSSAITSSSSSSLCLAQASSSGPFACGAIGNMAACFDNIDGDREQCLGHWWSGDGVYPSAASCSNLYKPTCPGECTIQCNDARYGQTSCGTSTQVTNCMNSCLAQFNYCISTISGTPSQVHYAQAHCSYMKASCEYICPAVCATGCNICPGSSSSSSTSSSSALSSAGSCGSAASLMDCSTACPSNPPLFRNGSTIPYWSSGRVLAVCEVTQQADIEECRSSYYRAQNGTTIPADQCMIYVQTHEPCGGECGCYDYIQGADPSFAANCTGAAAAGHTASAYGAAIQSCQNQYNVCVVTSTGPFGPDGVWAGDIQCLHDEANCYSQVPLLCGTANSCSGPVESSSFSAGTLGGD